MHALEGVVHVLAIVATVTLAATVEADDAPEPATRRGAATSAPATPRSLYREECGACHLDYPPGLLPARSWERIMAGLDRHFGTDASVEPEIRDRLERWLAENAAEAETHSKSRKALRSLRGEAPLRISEVPYVRREHHEIRPGDLARPSVQTIAHCAGCHPGAGGWDFEEHLEWRSHHDRPEHDAARGGWEHERDRARMHDR